MLVAKQKFAIILFSSITIAALVWLAAGLSGLRLLPGQPFPFSLEFDFGVQGGIDDLPGGQLILRLVRGIYLISLLFLPFALIYLIISPEARRRLWTQIVRIFPYLLTFILVAYAVARIPAIENILSPNLAALPEGEADPAQLAEFVPDPPEWLETAAIVVLAIALTAVIGASLWLIWRQKRRQEDQIQRIAREAQDALNTLAQGGDLKNTIIRCYYEMSQTLSEQRDIRRDKAMTTREFEELLVAKGLPSEPVWQLTQLFEEVRYGGKAQGEQAERRAVASLTAIVVACRN